MKRYVSTTANKASGESLEMVQLAEAMGAELVTTVPSDGLLVYMVNLNIRRGTEDLHALAERKVHGSGINVFLVGICRGWDELETWRPYFDLMRQVGHVIFASHPTQVAYLQQYGIEALLKPLNEQRYEGDVEYTPNTIAYTGFLWDEKDIQTFIEVALLLPDWQFTLHVGAPVNSSENLPDNCRIHGELMPHDQYMAFLAGFEYIWIPRKRSPWVYAGRSGLSAVASGRPAILTDVPPNDVVPADAAIKYPLETSPEKLAKLIAKRPLPDPEAVKRLLDSTHPEAVWGMMKGELEKRGLI